MSSLSEDIAHLASVKTETGGAFWPELAGERIANALTGGSATIGIASDSTGNDLGDWPRMWLEILAQSGKWPNQRLELANGWNDATSLFNEYVVQPGVSLNPTDGTEIYDTFSRTGPVSAAPADSGGVWSGNGWSCLGNGLAQGSNAGGMAYTCSAVDGAMELNLRMPTLPAPAATVSIRMYYGSLFHTFGSGLWASLTWNASGALAVALWQTISGTSTNLIAAFSFGAPISTAEQTANIKLEVQGLTATLSGSSNGGAVTTNSYTLTQSAKDTLTGIRGLQYTGAPGLLVDSVLFTAAPRPATYNLVRVVNGSVAGSTLDYQQSRISRMWPGATPIDVMIVSSGHNYGALSASEYVTKLEAFTTAFAAVHPETKYLYVSQNPEYPPASYYTQHRRRLIAGKKWAREKGHSYLPAREVFEAERNPMSYLESDGLHPTTPYNVWNIDKTKGSVLWAYAMQSLIDKHLAL